MNRLFLVLMTALLAPGMAHADPPGNVMVGATLKFKSDSFDAYSTMFEMKTATTTASPFGVSLFPESKPLILTNNPNNPSVQDPFKKFARVKLASRTMSGYIVRSGAKPAIDFGADVLKQLQADHNFHFCTGIKELTQPPFQGLIISTINVSCAHIDPSSVEAIQKFAGPLDGSAKWSGNISFDPRLVKRQDQGPPNYFCQDGSGWGLTWVSYNPKVGESELAPLCERMTEQHENPPSEDEKQKMLKQDGVYFVNLGWD